MKLTLLLLVSSSSSLLPLTLARTESSFLGGQQQQQKQPQQTGTANHFSIQEERDPFPQCVLEDQIVTVQWNAAVASYVPVVDDRDGEERRHLRESATAQPSSSSIWGMLLGGGRKDDDDDDESSWTPAMQVGLDMDRRQLVVVNEEEETPETTFLVRACYCDDLEPVYCPVDMDLCRTVGKPDSDTNITTIGCFAAKERMAQVAETSFFIATLWLLVLFGCITCAPCGRTVIHYVWDKYVSPGHSERLIDYMMENQRHRAFLLLRRGMYHNRWGSSFHLGMAGVPNDDKDDAGPPTSLALKTHVFQIDPEASHNHHHDEDGENLDTQCIICFQQLQHGERAGDLLCGHTFHADCLKTWLKRRNTCPLCNATEVAKPCHHKAARPRAQTQSTTVLSEEDGASSIVDGASSHSHNLVLRTGMEEGGEDQQNEENGTSDTE
eukprot:scaffold34110_cov183-Amphora_coffeaeformis.AAC.3